MALSPVACYYVPQQYKHFENQIRDVILAVESREKVMLLLRGLPGSGKSTFANVLISCSGQGEICSADSYFYDQHGNYNFALDGLQNAHAFCRRQVQTAMENNEALVIVDNTNIEKWQMVPYSKMAVKHGYHIILLEPNTSWRRNVHQLTELNIHGIPKSKISELKRRYEAVTVASLVPSQRDTQMKNSASSNAPNPQQVLPQRSRRKARTDRPCSAGPEPSSSPGKDSHEGIPCLYSGRQYSATDYNEGVSSLQLGSPFHEWQQSLLDKPQLPPRARVKKKKNTEELNARELRAMFEPVRAMTEARAWSELSTVGADTSPVEEKRSVFLKPKVTSVDVETSISELDEVLLNGDVDLAVDLGYKTLEAMMEGLKIEDEERGQKKEDDADLELINRLSVLQNKATQTASDEPQPSPAPQASSVSPALDSLRRIFPHKSLSELAEVLEQAQGDVEWAADVCLQLDTAVLPVASVAAPGSLSPPSRHSPVSELSSPPLSGSSQHVPRLTLTKDFIQAAHKSFGEELNSQLDVDLLPPGLYEDWIPPPHLVKKIYASYLEFLGLRSSPTASEMDSPPIIRRNSDDISVTSDDNSEDEAHGRSVGQNALPVTQRADNGFRGIMQEEEDIEKVMTEKRKTLVSDVASRLKFDRLRAQYSQMEENLLMDIFISFQCNEEATIRHLACQGYTPSKQAPIAEEEDDDELSPPAGRLWESKEQLIHKRDNLSRRKEALSNQLRKMMDDKKLKVASPYYIEELKDCDRQLQLVKEKLRNIRVSEQTDDHLDLHHFTLAEALKSLKERLEVLRGSKKRHLTVFTGVGRHSQGAAKLRPAVNQILAQKGYRFKEVRDGVFQINL